MTTTPTSFAAALAQDQPPAPGPDLRQKTATLRLKFTDFAGKSYDCEFTNNILTIAQKISVSRARAAMSGGLSPESLDPRAYGLLYALCWMKVSVSAAPEWFSKLESETEEELVEAIWEQIDLHERTFRGRDKRPS